MKKKIALLLASMFILSGCGAAKEGSGNNSSVPDYTASAEVSDENSFIITLYCDKAPITCENFINLVSKDFYDGLTFHRVVDDFMAQGGDPQGTGMGGSEQNIKGEFASNGVDNDLSHQRGVISMARSGDPNSASSQFFICYTDCSFLDGSYAAFGEVTQGMEVVDNFLKVGRSLGGDGAISAPNTPIVMKDVNMIEKDSNGNPRVQVIMDDFLG
ncbi:MAG: peptidylprolyl isomerase [Ruminococcus sp.]|nr:peptidylprolyl isomerase [Ruminococcus sp.]